MLQDLNALRRFFWLPALAVVLGVLAALAFGAFTGESSQARFRTNVIVDALPPLFGPAVLPGPFDYAALAMSDPVIDDVGSATGVSSEALRPRMRAEPRVNSSEITFTVNGGGAIAVARAWYSAFASAVVEETAAIERRLVEPYREQLAQAQAQLDAAAAGTRRNPDNSVEQQELVAAEANYETAARLVQSYDVVAATMKANSFTTSAPHVYGGGVGSTSAQIAAGAMIGLLAGVLGAVCLAALVARGDDRDRPHEPPSQLRRPRDEAGTSAR